MYNHRVRKLYTIIYHWLYNSVSYLLTPSQVIDLGGEPITSREYTSLGRVTEFKYGAKLGTVFRKWNGEKLAYTKYVWHFFKLPPELLKEIYRIITELVHFRIVIFDGDICPNWVFLKYTGCC